MQFFHVVLAGFGYELPPERWTSEAIEERLEPLYSRLRLPQGRLELMTGIHERRFWPQDMRPSAAAASAATKLLEQKRDLVKKNGVDLLIHAGVCRDRLEPSTAAYVHNLLKLDSKTQIADISNACLGFLNAMVLAAGLIESRQIQTALIVSGENGKPLLQWTLERLLQDNLDRQSIKPYFANLTIGAGSCATLLCHSSLAEGLLFSGGCAQTNSGACFLCEGGSTDSGLEMQTDSEALLTAGIELAQKTWADFKNQTAIPDAAWNRFITHQVGKQHQKYLYEALGLDVHKDFSTFKFLGNVGSVSLPLTLAISLEKAPLQSGEKVALLGIGSGLSAMMLALTQP